MSFFLRLSTSCRRKKSLLCVGLDPRVGEDEDPAVAIIEQNTRIIEATLPYAAAYKPNIAFYECHGPAGLEALSATLKKIPDDVPVIIDAKRNDIGSTAKAYATGIFEYFNADAVTLNAYLGRDSIEPFAQYGDRGMFLLCRTSNAGGADFQELEVNTGDAPKQLFLAVAEAAVLWSRNIGLVVGGNDPSSLAAVRKALPEVWILAPGIGAQGGSVEEAITAGMRDDGLGILSNVSRSIADAEDPAVAARVFRDDLNNARDAELKRRAASDDRGSGFEVDPLRSSVMAGLVDSGCFKLGEFILKSGQTSPFYVDLRRIGSNPALLANVAKAYAKLLTGIEYDRIAGIPVAGLPLATALALEVRKPLIIPRMEKKDHGTGNKIEGEWNPGEKVLLLDDLITTGGAKLEAAELLRNEGLIVEDLVVLLERGTSGRVDMEKAGITLHSYAHVEELFETCEKRGLLDDVKRGKLKDFVRES
ncbi:MAG: orotidine-5'-phosphate decarboxylase [Spirochaetales bacterium]|jgi:uridine monophosphate synthetase|nr:orotidine-5'-phosphate decarboxylase [Spirochaetales bacterium]